MPGSARTPKNSPNRSQKPLSISSPFSAEKQSASAALFLTGLSLLSMQMVSGGWRDAIKQMRLPPPRRYAERRGTCSFSESRTARHVSSRTQALVIRCFPGGRRERVGSRRRGQRDRVAHRSGEACDIAGRSRGEPACLEVCLLVKRRAQPRHRPGDSYRAGPGSERMCAGGAGQVGRTGSAA